MILLIAFLVVEAFFSWLIVFPDTPEPSAGTATTYTGISGTREVDVSGLIKDGEDAQRLEDWQKFVAELGKRYSEDHAIAFVDLDNADFDFGINADQEFIAASTYKLFAAYAMLSAGNPPNCLDSMIIYSENDCVVDYLNSYGWRRLGEDAKRIGAERTWFDETTHTTASDLAVILKQIYDGSLFAEQDNNRLLGDMKKQIFRAGIPAGIPEAEVADKVGFLDDLLHDAGIVYSPKGDFLLVILTDKGYDWDSIAAIASEIYEHI
jgi:beta-lactamase class A